MKKLSISRRPLAAALSLLPFAAFAQSGAPATQLDPVVVTASRSPQPEQNVIGDVSVIDAQELQQAGQSSLADVLARHRGIQMYDSGGPQTVTGLYLRGTNTDQTLVLIDGMRINSALSGSVNWNAIDPATVERVEVIRGAASSLYGSDAIGGVVNIITKKGGERPLSAYGNFGVGSYGTVRSSLGLSGASQGWDYALASQYATSEGFNATNRQAPFGAFNPDTDGYTRHSLSGSLGYQWKPGHRIGLTAYNSYINGDYDNGDSHPAYFITRQQAYTLSSSNAVTEYWDSLLQFGFTQETTDDRDPGYPSRFGSLQRSYSWQNTLKLARGQELSLVLERREERPYSSATRYSVERRDTNAAGLIYRGDFGMHHVQASVRNDTVTGYGSRSTGSVAYDLDITPEWQVGVAANTGFRVPTFNDLYAPSYWGGNPSLVPETSRNVEAHLNYRSDGTEAGITVYQNRISNLIISDSNYVRQNLNAATLRGLTLSGSQRLGKTTLRASADFLNPRNDDTGAQLNRRARQVYRLSADHRLDAWTLGAEYQFTGKRYDDTANTVRLGGYSLLNLTASYDLSRSVAVQVRWNNVLNKDYANAYGYNTPGSNIFVNLAVRM